MPLEGNTLTWSETQLVLEKGIAIGGEPLIEHLEVVGHKDAIDYVEELAQRGAVLGEREIRDLHNLIRRGIDRQEAGRCRTLDVKAAGTEHVYPAHDRLPELMEGLVSWLSSKAAQALPAIPTRPRGNTVWSPSTRFGTGTDARRGS